MGISKSAAFTLEQNQMALRFKALSHPARIAIVEYLLKAKSCICGDIVNELPLAQATVSQHLKELKSAGIIQGTIDGNSICYCLNPQAFDFLKGYCNAVLNGLSRQNPSCC